MELLGDDSTSRLAGLASCRLVLDVDLEGARTGMGMEMGVLEVDGAAGRRQHEQVSWLSQLSLGVGCRPGRREDGDGDGDEGPGGGWSCWATTARAD